MSEIPHKRPVTSQGIVLLIEDCERTSAALSMRPTPFQLEQAVNFLVSNVPAALRNLEEQLEMLREALVDISHAADNPDAAPGHFGFLARRALGSSLGD